VTVAVVFSVQVAAQVYVGEGDLGRALDAAPDVVDPEHLVGQVVLLAAGQPVVFVEDDLEFAVQQLLEGVPELAAGRAFALGFSEAPGRVELAPEGAALRVTTGYTRAATVPLAETLEALAGCCERFVAFARARFGERAGTAERMAQLDPWLSEARAALVGRV